MSQTRNRLTKRDSFSDAEKVAIYDAYDGRCADCGIPLDAEWHLGGARKPKMTFTIYDANIHHSLPFYNGGKHAPSNWELLCIPCHIQRHRAIDPMMLQESFQRLVGVQLCQRAIG